MAAAWTLACHTCVHLCRVPPSCAARDELESSHRVGRLGSAAGGTPRIDRSQPHTRSSSWGEATRRAAAAWTKAAPSHRCARMNSRHACSSCVGVALGAAVVVHGSFRWPKGECDRHRYSAPRMLCAPCQRRWTEVDACSQADEASTGPTDGARATSRERNQKSDWHKRGGTSEWRETTQSVGPLRATSDHRRLCTLARWY